MVMDVISRPVSSPTSTGLPLAGVGYEIMLDPAPPVTVSVRGPGLLPASPRTILGTQSVGTFGEVDVQVGGRSTSRLKPGPGSSWLPEPSVARGEFGPVGSTVTLVPLMFSPAESAAML